MQRVADIFWRRKRKELHKHVASGAPKGKIQSRIVLSTEEAMQPSPHTQPAFLHVSLSTTAGHSPVCSFMVISQSAHLQAAPVKQFTVTIVPSCETVTTSLKTVAQTLILKWTCFPRFRIAGGISRTLR
jgi:hypothetical protein